MAATNPSNGRDKPKCGAKKRDRSGNCCRRPAGWGTSHPGTGRCKLHGGATRDHVVHARREEAQHALRSLGVDDPVDDPIFVLRQLAGTLRAAVDTLAERIGDELVTVDPDSGQQYTSPLLGMWRDLVDRLHRALAELAKVGVPDTVVNVNVGMPVSQVLNRVVEVVRPYPDAAAAVSGLLLELSGQREQP